jgi:hypothetical protein
MIQQKKGKMKSRTKPKTTYLSSLMRARTNSMIHSGSLSKNRRHRLQTCRPNKTKPSWSKRICLTRSIWIKNPTLTLVLFKKAKKWVWGKPMTNGSFRGSKSKKCSRWISQGLIILGMGTSLKLQILDLLLTASNLICRSPRTVSIEKGINLSNWIEIVTKGYLKCL